MGSDSPRSRRCDQRSGQKAGGASLLGLLLELGSRRGAVRGGARSSGNRLWIRPGKGVRVDLTSRLTSRPAAIPWCFCIIEVAARFGIGVGAAANDRQRDRAGRLLFDFVTSVAGPFGTDLVELAPESRAMARVTKEHRLDLAVRVDRPEHRQAVVDRSIGIHPETDPAAILQVLADWPRTRLALGPTPGLPAPGAPEPSSADFFNRVGQLSGVALDMRPLVARAADCRR